MRIGKFASRNAALSLIATGLPTAALTLIALMALVSSGIALGQPLRLVERPTDARGIAYAPPRDPTVCDAYLRNLNALPEDSLYACTRGLDPASTGFTQPHWEPLDPAKHVELIRKIERRKYPKNPQTDEEWLARFQSRLREHSVALSVAELDVLNADGVPEKVLRYEPLGACRPDSPAHRRGVAAEYFVIDAQLKDFVPPFDRRTFLIPGVRHHAFIYQGKVYFDFISDSGGPGRRKLIVQETHANLRPTPVCVYEFAQTDRAPKGAPR
jgi:hypothetical protein